LELNEVKTQLDGIAKEVKSDITKVTADLETVQKSVDALTAKVEKAAIGAAATEKAETKSAFELAFEAKAAEIKSLERGGSVTINLDTKAVADMFAPVVTQTLAQQAPAPAVTNLRDVIQGGTTTANNMSYVQEKGFYGAPAMTGEGALKAKVSLDYESKNEPVRKLTAYFRVSTELRDDAPAMLSYIQNRVVQEMTEVENAQLAYGTGAGQDLKGFVSQASAFNPGTKKIKGAQLMDVLRLAILQVRKARRAATAILLNPADVAELDLTKDADGNYLLGSLYTNATPSLRGVRIIEQDVIEEGTFVVGDFANSVQIFDRQGLSISIFDQNGTDAVENMLTIVIEKRLVQVVYRPEALVKGTFADAITAINK
jgi:HK97 family phage major capsid protein